MQDLLSQVYGYMSLAIQKAIHSLIDIPEGQMAVFAKLELL